MQHDQTYQREWKNLVENEDEGSMSEYETEKAFVNPNENDNDDVSVSDNTRDE